MGIKKISLAMLFIILFSACSIKRLINTNYTFITGNNAKYIVRIDSNKVDLSEFIAGQKDNKSIALVTAKQLRNSFEKDKYNLVLLYRASQYELNLTQIYSFIKEAKKYNFTPWVVLYKLSNNYLGQDLPIRLWGINDDYYFVMPDYYVKMFVADLTGGISDFYNGSTMMLFKGREFLRCLDERHLDKEFAKDRIDTKQKVPYSTYISPYIQ